MTFDIIGRIILSIFTASVLCSIAALMFGAHVFGATVTIPALIISIWAFGGHLITLDDDSPGGWSNPSGSKEFWAHSQRQLAIKFIVMVGVIWLYFLHK